MVLVRLYHCYGKLKKRKVNDVGHQPRYVLGIFD